MPSAIKKAYKAYSDPGRLLVKINELTQKAEGFADRTAHNLFEAAVQTAINNPKGFSKGIGYVAATGSSILIAKRFTVPELAGVRMQAPMLLGRLPIAATSRLLTITRRANVLLNETDAKDVVKLFLTKVRPVRQGAELVSDFSPFCWCYSCLAC